MVRVSSLPPAINPAQYAITIAYAKEEPQAAEPAACATPCAEHVRQFGGESPPPNLLVQGSADSRISESLRLSPCHGPRFWALIAVAALSQKVDVYHVRNRRL